MNHNSRSYVHSDENIDSSTVAKLRGLQSLQYSVSYRTDGCAASRARNAVLYFRDFDPRGKFRVRVIIADDTKGKFRSFVTIKYHETVTGSEYLA